MLMKDKKTGEVVGMRYGDAMSAQEAGTHEVVNESADIAQPPEGPGDDTPHTDGGGPQPVSEDMTKAELEAEAERRGVTVPSGATKADIVALLNG